MRRLGVVLAALAGLVAIPATASANHGTTCGYTSTQAIALPVPGTGLVIYEGSGTSGQAAVAGGVCLYNPTSVGPVMFAGGTLEAGAGTPAGGLGLYAVWDGDNANIDPTGSSDGYVGVSNFETAPPKGNCAGGGAGTNSGGCLDTVLLPPMPVPLIICGNTSGNTWDATMRDGCSLRDFGD